MNDKYETMIKQAKALTDGEDHVVPNLANLSALVWENFENINWAGFYTAEEGFLLLGPFQGKPACIRIPWGKGVCGTAAETKKTQVVPDVHKFPGHIACDSASNSEVVVPMLSSDGKVLAVLDVDSPVTDRFTEDDVKALEAIAEVATASCKWD